MLPIRFGSCSTTCGTKLRKFFAGCQNRTGALCLSRKIQSAMRDNIFRGSRVSRSIAVDYLMRVARIGYHVARWFSVFSPACGGLKNIENPFDSRRERINSLAHCAKYTHSVRYFASGENRTRALCLEGRRSAIKLHSQIIFTKLHLTIALVFTGSQKT